MEKDSSVDAPLYLCTHFVSPGIAGLFRLSVTSMVMPWIILLGVLSAVTSIYSINRPVYKIVLTQKGFAQFLQYDVETPPLREFTFCTWIRVYDFGNDQTILSYVAKRNHRILRLWLDTGGRYMKLSINEKVTSSIPVEISKDVWRHVCLSYQSDFGAWALYIDSRLSTCEAAHSLYGYVLPGGGSVIVGYGSAENGASSGFEGEIFGANMILTSTIEKNFTIKQDPFFEQKSFKRNQIKNNNKKSNYVVLSDLQTDDIHNSYEKIIPNPSQNVIKTKTPYSSIDHDIGIQLAKKNPVNASEEESFDFSETEYFKTTGKPNYDVWVLVNQSTFPESRPTQKYKQPNTSGISEFETPPPAPHSIYFDNQNDIEKQINSESIYKLKDSPTKTGKIIFKKTNEPSEVETPPPIERNNKVYGQWTSSKFAGTVLNYLKSINFHNKEQHFRKVPTTIPLSLIPDAYPYASDLKLTKLKPPSTFKRRNLIEKRYSLLKRAPQINVQILEDDIRSRIQKMHAQTHAKKVEITNRGEVKKHMDHRFYRNANYDISDKSESVEDVYKPKPFTFSAGRKKSFTDPNIPNQKYKSVLPFLKSLEYSIDDTEKVKSNTDVNKNNDMYLKSLKGNKWHNVKSYNNDYTPRKIELDSEDNNNITNRRHPAVLLKYKHEGRKLVEKKEDPTMVKGRKLALEVSNQSDVNKDSVSILKYNKGYLLNNNKNNKMDEKKTASWHVDSFHNRAINDFDKHIKIGNVLNERHVIGNDENQRKQSFFGGHDNIPSINVYRSDLDKESSQVPSSLGPKACKNVELFDHFLYIQPDESIDMTHIFSPVKQKNLAIEFIIQNYKKCSLRDSTLESSPKLFIDWSKTPVRLFGGAYPRTTTDLCGFF